MRTEEKNTNEADGSIRLKYGEEPSQYGYLRIPERKGPHPVVIVIHGGYWKSVVTLDMMEPMAIDFSNHGFASWNIEYRRVGNEGGGYPGTMEDVAAAADYLQDIAETYNLDVNRVVVIGHSAGGQLALWLAGRQNLPSTSALLKGDNPLPLKGVVSLAGVNDLATMWNVFDYINKVHKNSGMDNHIHNLIGGSPAEYPERYKETSPSELLPLNVSQVLIHGDLDVNVPFKLHDIYHELAVRAGDEVKAISFSNVEHFEVIDTHSTIWPTIRGEVAQLISRE